MSCLFFFESNKVLIVMHVAITVTERPKNNLSRHDLKILEDSLSAFGYKVFPIESYGRDSESIYSESMSILNRSKGSNNNLVFVYAGHGDVENGESVLKFENSSMSVSRLCGLLKHPRFDKYGVIISACRSTDFLNLSEILGIDKCLSIVASDNYQKSKGSYLNGIKETDLITAITDGIMSSKYLDVNLRELNLTYRKENSYRRINGESIQGVKSGNADIYVRNLNFFFNSGCKSRAEFTNNHDLNILSGVEKDIVL